MRRLEAMPVKLLFAPDSFKGSFTSVEIIQVLRRAAYRHFGPKVGIIEVPMADGGEGTVDAFVTATRGEYYTMTVAGPLGAPTTAKYGIINSDTAVIEMAQASGLPLVPLAQRNPLYTSSYGTGELLRAVLRRGIGKIVIGLGGSATNDGGMGMLRALGARFVDAKGNDLPGRGVDLGRVQTIELDGLLPEALSADITCICDVSNPLLGPTGATYVYGPQKGAVGDILTELENGMAHYAHCFQTQLGREICRYPGCGAAGGLGGAFLGVLNAKLRSGADVVLETVQFDRLLEGVSLVVTGEGQIDGQSARYGKVPAGVLRRCQARGIPAVILAGSMGPEAETIFDSNETSILTAVNAAMPLEDALQNAPALLESAADRLFRFIKIGMSISRLSPASP